MTLSAPAQTWVSPDFSAIALRIQRGDISAESELVTRLRRGVRFVAARQLDESADVDDTVSRVFNIAIGKIRAGKLQDHQGVLGCVQSILTNLVQERLEQPNRPRSMHAGDGTRRDSEKQSTACQEARRRIQKVLRSLNERDQEVLRRFYLNEQPQHEICEEMGISPTEFRSIKSRVMAKLGSNRAMKLQPPALGSPQADDRECVKS